MTITYSVTVDRPTAHRAQFTMQIPDLRGEPFEVVLPSWVPGSYVIQDPVRSLRDLRASPEGSEERLEVTRVDKARWRVTPKGAPTAVLRYTVYGHQMLTDALDVTPEHLFVNAGMCFPYVEGRKDEPHEVRLHVPAGWKVFTELSEAGTMPHRYRATDYDELVDSPIDCGTPVELTTLAAGIPHRILLCGPGGNYEPHRLEEDLKRIAEATIRFFGGSPIPRYTFFVHLNDVSDGALEHRASVSCVVPRDTFRPESRYRWFLTVCTHEYFHLYNVKRIRPQVLGPFDYTRENYSRLLWAMEGTTDYYARLLLRRAGLVGPAKTLEKFASEVTEYLKVPGRAVTDLESASFQAWVDFYRPFEETVNQSVSYYLKGELVSLCLDLEIRHRTENRRSLDHVWRQLWNSYESSGRGLEEDGLLPVVEEVAGGPFGEFFDRYVRGTADLDVGSFSRHAGLEFVEKPKSREPEDDAPPGYPGIDFENRGGLVRVLRVLEGGPGRRLGLSPGDEIVAVNGSKVVFADFSKYLEKLPAGAELRLAVFRRGWLTQLSGTSGSAPPDAHRFSPVASPTPLQRAIYESWLEAPWEPVKSTESKES